MQEHKWDWIWSREIESKIPQIKHLWLLTTRIFYWITNKLAESREKSNRNLNFNVVGMHKLARYIPFIFSMLLLLFDYFSMDSRSLELLQMGTRTDIRRNFWKNYTYITHIFNTFFLLFLYTTDYLSVKNTEFKIRNHASLLHGQEAQIKSVPAMETGARK